MLFMNAINQDQEKSKVMNGTTDHWSSPKKITKGILTNRGIFIGRAEPMLGVRDGCRPTLSFFEGQGPSCEAKLAFLIIT